MVDVSLVLVRASVRGAGLRDLAPEAATARFVSVSHTDGLSAIATCEARVGVDLERVRNRAYLDRLAARVMNAEEHTAWRTAPDRLVAFAQHWTRYEAYVKALGRGIAAGYRARPEPGWSVVDLDLPAGDAARYAGAIAVEAAAPVIRCRWSTVRATSR